MARLIRYSQNFYQTHPAIISLLEELLNLELMSVVRFKYNEIITTGIYHDAVVPNFKKIFEDDSHHAWELAMILSSYGIKPKLNTDAIKVFSSVFDFIQDAICIKKSLIQKYLILRDQLNDAHQMYFDPSAALILEEIITEERMNLNELIKLSNQSSFM